MMYINFITRLNLNILKKYEWFFLDALLLTFSGALKPFLFLGNFRSFTGYNDTSFIHCNTYCTVWGFSFRSNSSTGMHTSKELRQLFFSYVQLIPHTNIVMLFTRGEARQILTTYMVKQGLTRSAGRPASTLAALTFTAVMPLHREVCARPETSYE